VLGIEGATQSSSIALASGVPTLAQFFGKGISSTIKEQLPPGEKVKLILAMNVLAHSDNVNDMLSEIGELMEPDTAFVSQSHYLVELIRKFEFDTIYHEHLRYYTLGSLMGLFKRHEIFVNDAEVTDFYGGSILVYAGKTPASESGNLMALMEEEREIDVIGALKNMKKVLLDNKSRLLSLLVEIQQSGKQITGIGAPMKASTLLNYYGITSDLVDYIAEVNQLKVGTVVPGVRIPVLDEDVLFQEQPDYALLLSWNMKDFLIPKYRSMGYKGKFILPVPWVEVVD